MCFQTFYFNLNVFWSLLTIATGFVGPLYNISILFFATLTCVSGFKNFYLCLAKILRKSNKLVLKANITNLIKVFCGIKEKNVAAVIIFTAQSISEDHPNNFFKIFTITTFIFFLVVFSYVIVLCIFFIILCVNNFFKTALPKFFNNLLFIVMALLLVFFYNGGDRGKFWQAVGRDVSLKGKSYAYFLSSQFFFFKTAVILIGVFVWNCILRALFSIFKIFTVFWSVTKKFFRAEHRVIGFMYFIFGALVLFLNTRFFVDLILNPELVRIQAILRKGQNLGFFSSEERHFFILAVYAAGPFFFNGLGNLFIPSLLGCKKMVFFKLERISLLSLTISFFFLLTANAIFFFQPDMGYFKVTSLYQPIAALNWLALAFLVFSYLATNLNFVATFICKANNSRGWVYSYFLFSLFVLLIIAPYLVLYFAHSTIYLLGNVPIGPEPFLIFFDKVFWEVCVIVTVFCFLYWTIWLFLMSPTGVSIVNFINHCNSLENSQKESLVFALYYSFVLTVCLAIKMFFWDIFFLLNTILQTIVDAIFAAGKNWPGNDVLFPKKPILGVDSLDDSQKKLAAKGVNWSKVGEYALIGIAGLIGIALVIWGVSSLINHYGTPDNPSPQAKDNLSQFNDLADSSRTASRLNERNASISPASTEPCEKKIAVETTPVIKKTSDLSSLVRGYLTCRGLEFEDLPASLQAKAESCNRAEAISHDLWVEYRADSSNNTLQSSCNAASNNFSIKLEEFSIMLDCYNDIKSNAETNAQAPTPITRNTTRVNLLSGVKKKNE